MRKSYRYLLSLHACLVASNLLAANSQLSKCVADICIGKPNQTLPSFISKFGKGMIRMEAEGSDLEIHCFYDADRQLWVEFEFSTLHGKAKAPLTGIFVTEIQLCSVASTPKSRFPDLISERGIKVGISKQYVLDKLGTPQRTDDVVAIEKKSKYLADDLRYSSKFGVSRLVYDDGTSSSLFNFLGFDGGKLRSMWFADRE